MSKEWKLFATNSTNFGNMETKEDRIRREHKFNNVIRNVETLSVDKLKEESDKLFDKRNQNNAELILAFKEKKLKSKKLIKKAKALKKKEKEAAQAKSAEAIAT